MTLQNTMNLYTVIDKQTHKSLNLDKFQDQDINLLIQFKGKEYDMLEEFPNINILVDSGAYAANGHGNTKTREQLIKHFDKYVEFIEKTKDDDRVIGYFDLDFVDQGLPFIKHLRRKLFDHSPKIIPVYHSIWGIPEYQQMCNLYDYISVCNLDGIARSGYLPLIKYAHQCGTKVHGLGVNDNRLLRQVPFDSVDSSVWISNAHWGYYGNKEIPKTTENNKKWRGIYERHSFIEELNRQNFFKEYWKSYFTMYRKPL